MTRKTREEEGMELQRPEVLAVPPKEEDRVYYYRHHIQRQEWLFISNLCAHPGETYVYAEEWLVGERLFCLVMHAYTREQTRLFVEARCTATLPRTVDDVPALYSLFVNETPTAESFHLMTLVKEAHVDYMELMVNFQTPSSESRMISTAISYEDVRQLFQRFAGITHIDTVIDHAQPSLKSFHVE